MRWCRKRRRRPSVWCALDEIPYEQMWEDDVTWFDALIERCFFRGYYIFEGDRMLDARVDLDK